MKANLPALLELILEKRVTQPSIDYRSTWQRHPKAANRAIRSREMLQKAVTSLRTHLATFPTPDRSPTTIESVQTRGKLKETLMAIEESAGNHEYIRKLTGGGQGTKQMVKYLLEEKMRGEMMTKLKVGESGEMITNLKELLPEVETSIQCELLDDNQKKIVIKDEDGWWIRGMKKLIGPGNDRFKLSSVRDAFPVGVLERGQNASDAHPALASAVALPVYVSGAQNKFENIIGAQILSKCEWTDDNALRIQLKDETPDARPDNNYKERVQLIRKKLALHKAFLEILRDTGWSENRYIQIKSDGTGYDERASENNQILDGLLDEELFDVNILSYLDVSQHSKNGIKNASLDKKQTRADNPKFDLKLVHHVERVGSRRTLPLKTYNKGYNIKKDPNYTRPTGDKVFLKENRPPRPYTPGQGHATGFGGTEGKRYTHNIQLGRWNNDGEGQLLGALTSISARFLHTKMCGPGSKGYDDLFKELLGKIRITLEFDEQRFEYGGYVVQADFDFELPVDVETEERNSKLTQKLDDIFGYFQNRLQINDATKARSDLHNKTETRWSHTRVKEILLDSVERAPEGDEKTFAKNRLEAMEKAVIALAISDDDRFHNRTFLRHKKFPQHDLEQIDDIHHHFPVVGSKYGIKFAITFRSDQTGNSLVRDEEWIRGAIKEALLTEVGWFGSPPSNFAQKRAAKLLVYQRKLQAKHWIPVGSYIYCKKLAEKNKICFSPSDSGARTIEQICRKFGNSDENTNTACQGTGGGDTTNAGDLNEADIQNLWY